jgi:hypothetical protein
MRYFSFILFLFSLSNYYSQTFSNTTTQAHNSWNSSNSWATAFTRTISVTGLPTPLGTAAGQVVLRQINVSFGNGTNSTDYSNFAMRLISPAGNTITITNAGSIGTTICRSIDIKYRDHPSLEPLSTHPAIGQGSFQPFNIGYYRVVTANDYSNLNGTNPNGTWTLSVIENTDPEPSFNKIELIFGSPIKIFTATGSAYDACAAPMCIGVNEVVIGNNSGFVTGIATDPALTQNGCSWNGSKDNTAWFYFQPTSASVKISISGFSTVQQSIVVRNTGTCGSPTYSVPTGGCPSSSPNNLYNNPLATAYTSAGLRYNHDFNLTGLTPGVNYYLIIDGQGAVTSDFYIEVESGAISCSVLLPIDLIYFKGENINDSNILTWATTNELNVAYFELEKSTDGINFKSLANINAQKANLNSKSQLGYQYQDAICNAYYRLKQVDNDGTFNYFKTIYLENDIENLSPKIFPNPANTKLTISSSSNKNTPATIILFDVSGREVRNKTILFNAENKQITLDIEDLQSGLYFIRIDNGFKLLQQKIVKE